jgi:hypothetical protein
MQTSQNCLTHLALKAGSKQSIVCVVQLLENRKEKIWKRGNSVLRKGLLTKPSTLCYVGFDVLATTFPFDGVTLNKTLRSFETVAVT